MLALDRSFGVVADLALFADHIDPKRVFYIPTRPRLARTGSTSELSFVKFREADAANGGVGLLSFTTELAATEQQLEQAKDALVRLGVAEPLLVQVPWAGGKAVFAAALQEGDGFVEKMYSEVTPDLIATNRAMFSALLTEEGARLVEALIAAEGPSPLGVRYELEYDGLRPALDVHVRADYQRIYKELSWGFQFGVAYDGIGVRASVESATQKLMESGAIQIEVLQFTDDADLRARVDEAIRWLQDKILEDFFKTSLQPPAQENLLQQAVDAAIRLGAATLQDALKDTSIAGKLAQELGVPPDVLNRLSQMAGGGQGASGMPGAAGSAGASESTFALKLQFTFRDIHQEELKTITLDWTEAHAERRTAAPQGLLSQFGVAPQVVEAAAAGTFWDSINVNVQPLGDFAELGVQRLVVQLAYPDENAPTSQVALTFEPGDSAPKRFAAWTDGKPPHYRARVDVHFDDHGPWPGPPVFTGHWQTVQSLDLAVHPLSDVPRFEVEISPGNLVFVETPQAQIDVRVGDTIIATSMLTAAAPTSTVRRRLDVTPSAPDDADGAVPAPPRIDARTTWFLAGGRRVEGEWQTVESTTLLIQSPWKSTRTIRVLPILPDDFIEALVTLTMVDGARTDTEELRIEAGDRSVKVVNMPSLAETPPPVQVDTVVIRGDGSTFVGPPVQTSDPIVIVRDRDGTFKQVAVRLLAGASLAGQGVMALQVQLLDVHDAPIDSVVFTESQRATGQLLVPADAGSPPARYRVVRYALDGSASIGPSQDITSAELLIPAVVRP
jgi:hypothetical protein